MTQKHELIGKEPDQFYTSFQAFVKEQCERFGVCPVDIELEMMRVLVKHGEYLNR